MKYRKKPIVIEAVQYNGQGNLHPRYHGQVPDWMWDGFKRGVLVASNGTDPLIVQTLEGSMVIAPGDWLIRGIKGELYPCKPDIFEATYERVGEDSQ